MIQYKIAVILNFMRLLYRIFFCVGELMQNILMIDSHIFALPSDTQEKHWIVRVNMKYSSKRQKMNCFCYCLLLFVLDFLKQF